MHEAESYSKALTRAIEAQRTWVHVRMDDAARWPRVTFTALVREHGVSRHTIARRAKQERWVRQVRAIHAERQARVAA